MNVFIFTAGVVCYHVDAHWSATITSSQSINVTGYKNRSVATSSFKRSFIDFCSFSSTGANFDYYSSQQSHPGATGGGGGGGGGGCYGNGPQGVTSRGNTTTASSGNPHLPSHYPSHYHPQPQPPHPPPPPNRVRDRSPMALAPPANRGGPPNRFFDDYETRFVVKVRFLCRPSGYALRSTLNWRPRTLKSQEIELVFGLGS